MPGITAPRTRKADGVEVHPDVESGMAGWLMEPLPGGRPPQGKASPRRSRPGVIVRRAARRVRGLRHSCVSPLHIHIWTALIALLVLKYLSGST